MQKRIKKTLDIGHLTKNIQHRQIGKFQIERLTVDFRQN